MTSTELLIAGFAGGVVGLVVGFVWRGFLRVDKERDESELIEADTPIEAAHLSSWKLGERAWVSGVSIVATDARYKGPRLFRVTPRFSHTDPSLTSSLTQDRN